MNLTQKIDLKSWSDVLTGHYNKNDRVYPKEILAQFTGAPHGMNYEKKFMEII